ncbi:hypothetical protein [Dyella terrae]|uniref:hypothetical protein n=1 Tax=Dyella terrae TaxID=522259 RepID=UPI001EFE0A0D|nr:hypothetical protein [Dyella terrae]ULU24079.1 hypothetical protein DYST_00986 [Dyella terrae]
MRNDNRFGLIVSVVALLVFLTPRHAIGQSASVGEKPENTSQMCMRGLWKALMPLVDAHNGYIVAGDLERIAKIKLPAPVSISSTDTISSLEWKAPYSVPSAVPGWPAMTGGAQLSMRLELHHDPSPTPHPYSWQRMQRRINGTRSSNLDLTCIGGADTLTLREAEADLEAIGLKRIGTLSEPQPVEVFYQGMKGRVDLYYDTPVATVPAVISVHVSGTDMTRTSAQSNSP